MYGVSGSRRSSRSIFGSFRRTCVAGPVRVRPTTRSRRRSWLSRTRTAGAGSRADVLRHRRSFRGEGPLEGWVWRAVVNAAHRARSKRLVLAPFPEVESAENGAPPAERDGDGIRPWLAALPERQRLAVFLRYYADLDYRTIASVLEIEVGTVSATLSAALTSLRRSLARAAQ